MAFSELLPALPWLLPFAALARLSRHKPDLNDATPVTDRSLSVIIPARNEAEVIERCIRSILTSTYPDLELIVVDDRSTDETAAIVEQIARDDGRVRLVRGEVLPEGWYGKPWACVQGYRAAKGEVLCFTDADSIHGPDLLPRAVGALTRERASLLTVMPEQLCISAAERLVLPQIFVLLGVRYAPTRVNRATEARDVIANGQFILMPRAEYERIGTHAAVKQEVAEDLAIAQETLRAGGKVWMEYAFGLMQVRMYTGWSHLVEGWSKNIYLGARKSFPGRPIEQALVPLLISFPFFFILLPPTVLLLSQFGIASAYAYPASIATGLTLLFGILIHLGLRVPLRWALGYPLGALAVIYIVLRSTLRGARKVEWKGRVYGTSVKG